MGRADPVEGRVQELLWPFLDRVVETWALPGVAVAVVHDGDRVTARGFGTRDRATGEPVTGGTLFHLASISKTFVATAVMQLVEAGELDLESGITTCLVGLPWADPRAEGVTLGHLLSHRSGLGDVSDYGWHRPELDDGALSRFASRVAGWQLEHDPGAVFAYSNAAYELLGHLVAATCGQTFEQALRERVLDRVGMGTSTFLRPEVTGHLGAGPHLGLPPRVVEGAYPYTRQHAPSSCLHSSAAEMGRWMTAHLAGGAGLMSPGTHEVMWGPRVETGEGGWHARMALGWFRGTYRGHAVVAHSGADPGFESHLVLLPGRRLGVTVLANSNTAPISSLTRAALDVLLGQGPAPPPPPPVTVPLAPVLERSGVTAAADLYRRLAAADPLEHDVDQDVWADAVWGLVEMHRTDLAWPLLDLWRAAQPGSSQVWFMSGWAHEVDHRRGTAVEHLRQALRLDPDNDDASTLLRRLDSGT